MALKAKHTVEEINGVRCTVVEKGCSGSRVDFLKKILEYNQLEVQVALEKKETDDAPDLFTVGVTDLVFHPVIAVYEMKLKAPGGGYISPGYWDQLRAVPNNEYWKE